MLGAVYMCAFCFGVIAPEDENEILALLRELADDRIGKFFPALALMRACCSRTDSQRCVEEQYPLLGPALQIPCFIFHRPDVSRQFFEYILKRRRQRHALTHRKAQAVGLLGAMVRVLAEDDDLYFVERAKLKGAENVLGRRVYDCVLILPFHKSP